MRVDQRVIASISTLAAAVLLSYLIPVAQKDATVISAFAAQACPAIPNNGSSVLNLPSAKLPIRSIRSQNINFATAKTSAATLGSNPILVDSNPGTSLVASSSAGIGYSLCSAGAPEEWFIGGVGGVTSKGILQLVNSGLSQSSVAIYPYSSQGPLPVVPVKVAANSSTDILLDSLVPGDNTMALRVVTLVGRMSSFVLDHRKKGLRELGIDYVAAQSMPTKSLTIPIAFASNNKKGSTTSALRFLVPGALDATVKVTITASDGTFVPVGFDQLTIKHGKVLQLPLTNLTTTGAFSVGIASDQPLLASGYTSLSGGDFAWASASPVIKTGSTLSLNFGGATPVLLFSGAGIAVDISGRTSQGKNFAQAIRGSVGADIAIWSPKVGINSITIRVQSKGALHAGALFTSGGIAYLPLVAGAQESNTNLPFIDLRTLTH